MKLTDPRMLAKYSSHVEACRVYGIEPMSVRQFLDEMRHLPERSLDSVLSIDAVDTQEPRRSYTTYTSPSEVAKPGLDLRFSRVRARTQK